MTDEIEKFVREMDAKYKRVALQDAITIEGDSTNDFYRSVTEALVKRPRGKYEVLCVHYPDPSDFVDPDTDDSKLDDEIDTADQILAGLTTVSGITYGWVIPKGDDKYQTEDLALVFSGLTAPATGS